MIIIVSPTKKMDFDTPVPDLAVNRNPLEMSRPRFNAEAGRLTALLRRYDREDLMKLMSVSEALAEKTAADVEAAVSGMAPVRPALFAYSGTVFQAMDPAGLGEAELAWAAEHLRILSGLFGILRPLDEVHPYRLEMKCSLPPEPGVSLAGWWRKRIMKELPMTGPIISLASAEYEKALDLRALGRRLIRLGFRERSPGGRLRTVGMYAKTARGRMLRTILEERPREPEDMKSWEVSGYRYSPEAGSDSEWIFIRDEGQN